MPRKKPLNSESSIVPRLFRPLTCARRQASYPLRVGRVSSSMILLCLACGSGTATPEFDLPSRSSDFPGGAEIVQDVRDLDFEAREERIYAEITRGNAPGWLLNGTVRQ